MMTDKTCRFYLYALGICFAMTIAIILPRTALAQQGEPPPLLKKFAEEKKATLHKLGHKHGLDGWLIDIDGQPQFAYSTPDGGIVFGVLLSPTGHVETVDQMRIWEGKKKDGILPDTPAAAAEQPAPTETAKKPQAAEPAAAATAAVAPPKKDTKSSNRSKMFYGIVEKAHWFTVGKNNAPYIYIFMNPSCAHCLEYWSDLQPYIEDGTIQVRMLPFGSTPDNRVPSAALLSSADPAAAWQSYVDGNKDILAADKVTAETAYNKSDSNTAIWTEWRLPATPFTVYRSPESGEIKVLSGRPENLLLLLSDFIR